MAFFFFLFIYSFFLFFFFFFRGEGIGNEVKDARRLKIEKSLNRCAYDTLGRIKRRKRVWGGSVAEKEEQEDKNKKVVVIKSVT